MTPFANTHVLDHTETHLQIPAPAPRRVPPRKTAAEEHALEQLPVPFQEALLEQHRFKSSSKPLDILVAFLFHVVLIGTPILVGLFYTDTINLKAFATTMLVAPPPPPPPPPAPAASVIKTVPVKRVFMTGGKLIAPTVIPKEIADIKEAPLPPDSFGGVEGGVPGGVPGGQMGGVLGGVIGGVLNTSAKPVGPPPPGKAAPVRIGGRVRMPKAIVQRPPEYPPLARQAHIQGEVRIDAVLDEQGNVIQMQIVSGPAVLQQAALDALSHWKYEPTYLNDIPIAVQMIITISFKLDQ